MLRSALHGTKIFDPERFTAFSDAVYAIIATVLVANIKFEDAERHAMKTEQDVYDAMISRWPSYVSFVMAFWIIFYFWVRHVQTGMVILVSTLTMQANFLALLMACLIPWARSFFDAYHGTVTGGSVFVASFMLKSLGNLVLRGCSPLRPGVHLGWSHRIGLEVLEVSAGGVVIGMGAAGWVAYPGCAYLLPVLLAPVAAGRLLLVYRYSKMKRRLDGLEELLVDADADADAVAEEGQEEEHGDHNYVPPMNDDDAPRGGAAMPVLKRMGSSVRRRLGSSVRKMRGALVRGNVELNARLPGTRLDQLHDGVFSIAATLIILDLPSAVGHPSQSGDGSGHHDAVNILNSLQSSLFDMQAFLICFLSIGFYWHINHNASHYLQPSQPFTYFVASGIHLMLISFLPYTSSVMMHTIGLGLGLPSRFLATMMAATTLAQLAMLYCATWRADALADPADRMRIRFLSVFAIVVPGCVALALVACSYVIPRYAALVFVLQFALSLALQMIESHFVNQKEKEKDGERRRAEGEQRKAGDQPPVDHGQAERRTPKTTS